MNTIAYTSRNVFTNVSSYHNHSTFEEFKTVLTKELSASIGKIKEYLTFKGRLDEGERQNTLSKPYMSLADVRDSIREREVQITHFIETLSDNQVTLLYLLFQGGSDLQAGTTDSQGDLCKLLYRYVDSEFNFSHTNNRQFKLSYFHDYLFVRTDAGKNVHTAMEKLGYL